MADFCTKYWAQASEKPAIGPLLTEAEKLQAEAEARSGQPPNAKETAAFEKRIREIRAAVAANCTPYEIMAINQRLVWMIPVPQTPDPSATRKR